MLADPFLHRVRATIRRRHLLDGVRALFVGFSGGADSTALLLAMETIVPGVTAVHLHHGLRPEADRDRAWCRDFCAARGIPFETAELDVPANRLAGESTEMAARRCRLAWWTGRLAACPGAAVALGHHRDDRIETSLLRLLRGANASGLTGLRHHRKIDGVTYLRPLLDVDRQEIEAWLASQHIADWCRDASNFDLAIPRNAVRHRLLPLLAELGGSLDGLQRTLDWLEEDAAFLEELLPPAAVGALAATALRALPTAAWPRVLRLWQMQTGGGNWPIAAGALARLQAALDMPSEEARRIDWNRRCFLRIERDRLYLEPRQPATLAAPVVWDWRRQPVLVLDPPGAELRARRLPPTADLALAGDAARTFWPAAELPCPLIVRARQPGDRLIPFGNELPVRLKKLVGGAKLSTQMKRCLPVVARPDGEILWLPRIRRSALMPVTASTDELVELAYHVYGVD